jgi:N-acetylglutamate synthase-like GNAT family acetyltransferase
MFLRRYVVADHPACVRVAASNTPDHILPDELPTYAAWLARACAPGATDDPCDYLVMEDPSGDVIACGGIAWATTAPVATLCWGIVRRDRHRMGLGTALLTHRLALARARGVDEVLMDTSQHALGFFLRFGFRVTSTRPDGYGPGLDRMDLALRIGNAA